MHVTGANRGKTRANEAWLVLGLLLIGWESGANFGNQSQSEDKPKQMRNYFRRNWKQLYSVDWQV